jgi:hypothetical protein
MRVAVSGARVSAAVAECIKLLDITQRGAGLLGDPGPQANFERTVTHRIEGTGRQGGLAAFFVPADGEDQGLVAAHRDNRRRQTDGDRRRAGRLRGRLSRSCAQASSSAKGAPS